MVVSPLEYRYGREEVKLIFDEDSRLKYLLTFSLEHNLLILTHMV